MTPIVVDVALLGASMALLWKGAEWIVDSAARIGRSLGLSDLVIGLTVVAFGTSAPEFAVTISAALAGRSEIALANVIGSNVFNLGFILGGLALFIVVPASRAVVRRDGMVLVGAALIASLALLDGRLESLEGGALIACLLAYLLLLFRCRAGATEAVPAGPVRWWSWGLLVVGLAAVAGGGSLLVYSASALAELMGIPQWVIGMTIVAAGTSASEMATSIIAAARGRTELLVGNLIGSDIFNVLGVLGVASLLRPIVVESMSALALAGLVVTCVVVALLAVARRQFGRLEGLLLVVLGLARWLRPALEP